jgi:hypothetical protein
MNRRQIRQAITGTFPAPPLAGVRGASALPATVTPAPFTGMTPRQMVVPFLALLILGTVLAFALGRVSNVTHVQPPALSLPRDTPAALPIPANVAPAGPRRFAPEMTPDARARTHWLLTCPIGYFWYETRALAEQAQQGVCGGMGAVHEPIK